MIINCVSTVDIVIPWTIFSVWLWNMDFPSLVLHRLIYAKVVVAGWSAYVLVEIHGKKSEHGAKGGRLGEGGEMGG